MESSDRRRPRPILSPPGAHAGWAGGCAGPLHMAFWGPALPPCTVADTPGGDRAAGARRSLAFGEPARPPACSSGVGRGHIAAEGHPRVTHRPSSRHCALPMTASSSPLSSWGQTPRAGLRGPLPHAHLPPLSPAGTPGRPPVLLCHCSPAAPGAQTRLPWPGRRLLIFNSLSLSLFF